MLRVGGFIIPPYVMKCFFGERCGRDDFKGSNANFLSMVLKHAGIWNFTVEKLEDGVQLRNALARGTVDMSANLFAFQDVDFLAQRSLVFSHSVYSYELGLVTKLVSPVGFGRFWLFTPLPRMAYIFPFLAALFVFAFFGQSVRGIGMQLLKSAFAQPAKNFNNQRTSFCLGWLSYDFPRYVFHLCYAAVLVKYCVGSRQVPAYETKSAAMESLTDDGTMLSAQNPRASGCEESSETYFSLILSDEDLQVWQDGGKKRVECLPQSAGYGPILEAISKDRHAFTVANLFKLRAEFEHLKPRNLVLQPYQAPKTRIYGFALNRNMKNFKSFSRKINDAIDYLSLVKFWERSHLVSPRHRKYDWKSARRETSERVTIHAMNPLFLFLLGSAGITVLIVVTEKLWHICGS